MLELLKQAALSGYCGIRTREALAHQVIRKSMCARGKLLGRGNHGGADIRLVKLLAALGDRRDECDAETASPIQEEVGEA